MQVLQPEVRLLLMRVQPQDGHTWDYAYSDLPVKARGRGVAPRTPVMLRCCVLALPL